MPTFTEVDHDPFAPASPGAAPAARAPAIKASPLDSALTAEKVPAPVADIARSIYQQESGSGRNTKTSNAGAVGGMQVIPSTFKSVADQGWDINNPEHNARAGVRYISQMYDKAGGDPALTAAGYYGGPGGLEKARNGVAVSDPRNPNAPNTLQYGQQVAARLPKKAGPTFTEVDHDPFATPAAPAESAAAPAAPADNSFLSNLAGGVKKGVTDLALGAKQRLDEGAAYMEGKFGGQSLNSALGLPNAAEASKQTQAALDQKRIDDAPLMETAGGKVGNVVGTAIPAAIAALIPGGQTLAGSAIIGGLSGLATPTAKDESVLGNAAAGLAGGAAGYGLAKGVGALAGKVADSAAARGILNAPKDTIAATARDAGYAIPPTQTNPGLLNSLLEGFSGKISTGQKASIKNQEVTNRLAAQELGLNPAQPISKDALNSIRRTAGQAYDAVSGTGQITPTSSYTLALDNIAAPYLQAARGFPNAPPHPVLAQIDALRSPTFDAASAVAKIKSLRAQADTAYRGGDKEVGGALKAGANALEDAIDNHLASAGAPANLLNNFREARQTIAKTYSVEKALNDSTGNVNAVKLASQLARGKPLSGDLKTIAQVGQAFPTAAKEVTSSMPGVSPLDFHGASLLGILGHGALGAATAGASLVARPLVRSGILSKPYQSAMGVPGYEGSALLNGLASAPSRIALQAAGPEGARRLISNQPTGFADGGMIGDEDAAGQAQYQGAMSAQQGQQQIAIAAQAAAGITRKNEAIGLDLLGEDGQALGYANGGMITPDPYAISPGLDVPNEIPDVPRIAQGADFQSKIASSLAKNNGAFINAAGEPDNYNSYNLAPLGLARNAINSSPVHDMMAGRLINSGMQNQGPVHSMMSESAFGSSKAMRGFKNGGMMGAPEMSGAIRALALGRSRKG